MNREIKQKWIAALRSGKFIQGRKQLKQNGCHCVIGVLSEVAGFDPTCHAFLERHVQEAVQLNYNMMIAIIEMNDTHRKTFEEIADFLERTDKL